MDNVETIIAERDDVKRYMKRETKIHEHVATVYTARSSVTYCFPLCPHPCPPKACFILNSIQFGIERYFWPIQRIHYIILNVVGLLPAGAINALAKFFYNPQMFITEAFMPLPEDILVSIERFAGPFVVRTSFENMLPDTCFGVFVRMIGPYMEMCL
jgi:hypothetical protein